MLPNQLCVKCQQELRALVQFIKLLKESEKLWNQITNFLKVLSPANNTKNLYIEMGNEIKTYTDTLRCTGNKITTKKDALRSFKIRVHREMVYKTSCHEKRKARGVLGSLNKKKMTCPECKAQFQCIFKFNKHINNLNKKMCSQCFKIVELPSFVEHAKNHNLLLYACPICPESFEKESALLSHKLKHARGQEECHECRQTFKNPGHLNKHMNKHKPIVCGCGKRYQNRVCFFTHKKNCNQHNNIESKYICDYCKVEYATKNCLKMHMKLIHTVGRLYQCDKCGKTFSSRVHLLEHSNTHDKVLDRYICECGAKYSTRRGYVRHSKKHLEETIPKDKNGKRKTKAYKAIES